ncbi:unnamed protein product [Dicrocoelium dendriticum]|nr:unnamed protein product [Dicrocoelium dendriticum]
MGATQSISLNRVITGHPFTLCLAVDMDMETQLVRPIYFAQSQPVRQLGFTVLPPVESIVHHSMAVGNSTFPSIFECKAPAQHPFPTSHTSTQIVALFSDFRTIPNFVLFSAQPVCILLIPRILHIGLRSLALDFKAKSDCSNVQFASGLGHTFVIHKQTTAWFLEKNAPKRVYCQSK